MTTSVLATGWHSLIAVYGGNATFIGSSSASLSEAVQLVGTTNSVASSAAPAALGHAVKFTATVSGANGGTPTGGVSFLDGTTVLGTATLQAAASGAQASFTTSSLALGSHSITVVYAGDSTFSGSTSANLVEMIQTVDTFATVSSSADPLPLGQAVTFTATVSGGNGGTPTGTITFEDGSTVLGTVALGSGSAGVQATFSTSALAAGPHTITAVYSGDTTFAGGSAALTQIVGHSGAAGSSTSLVASTGLAGPGDAVTLTAAVVGAGGGTPGGTVTFLDGGTVLGSAPVSTNSSTGLAIFTTSSLGLGAHTLSAVYGGDGTFAASASASRRVAVQLIGTGVSLTSSADPAAPGQAVTLSATVGGADGGTPGGTVTFLDGGTVLGTATLAGNSTGMQATFTTSSLADGMHTILAAYGGDGTYAAGSSATLSQAVQVAGTSTSVTSSVDPALVGQSVTITATVVGAGGGTPTGTVTFKDGSTVLGSATLGAASSGAQATITASGLAVGAHCVTAVYGGDGNFAGSTSASMDEAVRQVVSYTAVASSIAVPYPGQGVTFTATVVGAGGGTPTGTVTFEDGSSVLGTVSLSAVTGGAQAAYTTSALGSGTHVITAVYNGDGTFLTSAASLSQSVGQSSTTGTLTTLSSSLLPAAPGQAVTLTAAVSSTSSSSNTPAGTVAFLDGGTLLGTATLSAATSGAEAAFTTSTLAAGTHSLSAVYGGDANFSGSASSPLSEGVQQIGTSTALTSSAVPVAPGQPVTFTATVSGADGSGPAGAVTFLDGATVLATVNLSATPAGAQAVYTTATLAAGTHSVTAVYAGNITYTGSTSVAVSEAVQQLGSYTSVALSAPASVPGLAVTLTATVVGADGGTPTGTVTFKDGGTVLGSATLGPAATGAQAVLSVSSLAAGAHSITAVYGGSSGYTGSTSVAASEAVQLIGSITSVSASADFTTPGQAVSFTATVLGVQLTAGTPSGTVTFLDGSTVLGSATLGAAAPGMPGGQATFTTSALAAGRHAVTAVYGGDGTFSGSSGSQAEVIGQSTAVGSSTTLTSSTTAAAVGQAVTFTAGVSASGGTPTGTVTFLDGATVLGTAGLSHTLGTSEAQAHFTTAALTAGRHAIAAVYGGDAAFSGSASAGVDESVGLIVTTATLSASDDSPVAGQAVTLTAAISSPGRCTPTGSVTFLDGSAVLGSAALGPAVGGAEASFTTAALLGRFHVLTAVYGGDGSFAAAASDGLSLSVRKDVPVAALSSSVNPAAPGQAVSFTATFSSPYGTPTGTVTFLDGGTVLGTAALGAVASGAEAVFTTTALANGTHAVTAVYNGDAVFSPASTASQSEAVQQVASTTLLASSANPAGSGQAVTFTATLSGADGGTPSGTVTFEDGSTVLGTGSLSAGTSGAVATFSTSGLSMGSHTITAVYVGDNTYAGSGASLRQGVGQGYSWNTTVIVYFSYNPATVGQPLSMEADVSSSAGGSPTGTVTFKDGSVVLGSANLSPSTTGAKATFTTTARAAGSHTIRAYYGGDGTFAGSSSGSMGETVLPAATTTSLETSADTAAPGQAVTFTATVAAGGKPGGTVSFLDGSTVLGSVALTPGPSGAQAAFTTSGLATGSHAITAVYSGDSTFASSTSDVTTETVRLAAASVSLSASTDYPVPGQAVTFTATVSSGGDATQATPTGTMTFEDGTAVLGTVSLSADSLGAAASLTIPNLASGSHAIAAVYGGDAEFAAASSPRLDAAVQQDVSSTALTATTTSPEAGVAVTFTAAVSGTFSTGTPTGTVTFLDGGTVLGTSTLGAAISGAEATFTTAALAIGSHAITAVYGGDAAFTGSTSAGLGEDVGRNSTSAALSSSAATVAASQAVTFTATITSSSGTPAGTVTFLDGGTVLGSATLSAGAQAPFTTSGLASGSHAITAIYGGSSGFAGSSMSLAQVVDSSTASRSSIVLSSSKTDSAPGQAVTLTAQVSGDDGGIPTGTVTFLDGSTVLGTASLSANFGEAQATYTTSSLTTATHSLTAVYGGDSSHAPRTSTSLEQVVEPVGSSVALSSSLYLGNPGQAISFTAAVSGDDAGTPTGTVTFLDGGTVLGSATLSAGQATFSTSSLALGRHSLVAVYGGSGSYAGGTSASLSQVVQPVDTSTFLTSSADTAAQGQALTLTATVMCGSGTPTGVVVFLDGGTVLGTASLSAATGGAQASLTTTALGVGTHFLGAVYRGDSNFLGGTSDGAAVAVQQVLSWTALASSAATAAPGQSVTFTATVLAASGGTPSGTVTFEDGSAVLGTVALGAASSGAQAAFTTSALSYGPHSISAVYGGGGTFVVSSASMLQIVGQISLTGTSTTLSASAGTTAPGQAVTYTATVTAGSGNTPTGTVTFLDGGSVLGTASLSAASTGSQASFTTANLALGSHALTAVYGGDRTYAGGSSQSLSQTVRQLGTSVSLASSAAPAAPGQGVTFTATVSGADGGTPTGTVTVLDGGTVLATAPLTAGVAGAQVVFTTSTLGNGTHSISAVYNGAGGYTGSTSAALSEAVQPMGSSVSLATSNAMTNSGLALTLTATVTGASGGTPGGTVTFLDGGTALGTATLAATASGMQALFTTSALPAGTHSISAVYGGDGGYVGSSSAALSQAVRLFQSMTSLSPSAGTVTAGQALTLTATVAGVGTRLGVPVGSVTFLDGNTVLGTATLAASHAGMQAVFTTSALASGTHALTAVYGGNGTFAASTSPILSEAVAVGETIASVSTSALAAVPGQAVTFTATVSGVDGGTPSGTVTFLDGSTVLGSATLTAATGGAQATFTTSALTAGSHSVSVVYNGDGSFSGSSSAALGQLVAQAGSFATLSSSANPVTAGQAVTFTATLSGTAGAAPTGTVTFEDGSTVLGSASLGAVASGLANLWSARATFSTSSLAAGTHAIGILYSGDAGYTASSATLTQHVSSSSGAASTTTLSSSATAAAPGQAVTFTATVSTSGGTPSGTVTFKDGSTVLGSATLSAASGGAQASFSTSALANGPHVLTAVYGGDGSFAGGTSAALIQSVRQATSTRTTLTSSSTSSAPGEAVTFTASVSGGGNAMPSGTVSFEDGSTVLATVTISPDLNAMAGSSGGEAKFTTSGLTLGTHTITAVYGGNSVFTSSTSTALSQTVQQEGTSTSLTSSADSTQLGQAVTFTAAVGGTGGATPTGTVTFEEGTSVLGIAVLSATSSGAQASLTTTGLAIGTHAISAVYNGDNGYIGSTAAAVTQTVTRDSSLTSLATTAAVTTTGQSVTFTATVSSAAPGTPTGTIAFQDGSTVLASVNLNSTAQASYSTTSLSVGLHTITAVYSGDGTFAGGASAIVNQIVGDGSTVGSTTAVASSNLQAVAGQVVTFTATVTGLDGGTPTGTVTFEDGSTVLGSASLAGGSSGAQASFSTSVLTAGTHSISAVYNGDGSYSGSTSPALSQTIQAGSPGAGSGGSNGTGDGSGGSGSGSSTGSSLLGGGFGGGASVADLFDGQLYGQAGIPTQMRANKPGTSSAATAGTTTTQTSSGNTAASLPAGPLDPSSSGLAVSGSYHKHYTQWGSNGTASFYLDVDSSSTFGASGETGTTVYTAYLEVGGSLVLGYFNVVVPFSYSTTVAGGTTLGNLPAMGASPNLSPYDFGLAYYSWDQMHYRESDGYNASASYTAANGASYSVKQVSSVASSWDSSRVYTDNGLGTGSGTAVYSNQYGNSYLYDLSASDVAGNFSGNTQYDASGYPTDLFGTPASGTTFLARFYDAGTAGGFNVSRWTVVNGVDNDVSGYSWFNGNSGVSGSRYYYKNSATVNGAGSGNSDTVSWNVSQQSFGSFGGSDGGNINYDASGLQNGTALTTSGGGGQSTSNTTLTDAYQRSKNGIQVSGNFYTSGGDTTPQSYSSQGSEKQTWAAGKQTVDTLQYLNSSGGGSSTSTSNFDTYTMTTPKGSGGGLDYFSGNSWDQGQDMASGTSDLVSDTGSVTAISGGGNGGWSQAFSTGSWAASDGSFSTSQTTFAANRGSSYTSSFVVGSVNAAGTQTGGVSYNGSGSSGNYNGFTTSTYTAAGYPTSTYTQVVSGNSSANATVDLEPGSDGSASGSIHTDSSNSSSTDTTTKLVGTQKLPNGTAFSDNLTHSKDVAKTSTDLELGQSAGKFSGTITMEVHDKNSWDYRIFTKVDLDKDVLHELASSSGVGTTALDDTTKETLYDPQAASPSRTVKFAQDGSTTGSVLANGKLKDNAGHRGQWDFNTTSSGNVDDNVTIKMSGGSSGWEETSRVFHINQGNESNAYYDESDNGLNRLAMDSNTTEKFTHEQHGVVHASGSTVQDGTKDNYTFNYKQLSSQVSTDKIEGSYSSVVSGDKRIFSSSSSSTRIAWNNRSGAMVKGQPNQSNTLDKGLTVLDSRKSDATWSTPTAYGDSHSRSDTVFSEHRKGNIAAGEGSRFESRRVAYWGSTTSRGILWDSTTKYGDPNSEPDSKTDDLSWPAKPLPEAWWPSFWAPVLWEGFKNDPYAGSVVQIGFGALDVIGGLAMIAASGGGAVIPGVGLMAVGVDQILTGAYNVRNPGQQSMSVFQFGGYQAALGVGASEGTAQIVGAMTPAVLALGFGAWGGLAGGSGPKRLFVYLTEEQYQQVVQTGMLGRGYQGWRRILWRPFDEGRIWATTYTPAQMSGRYGKWLAMLAGIDPKKWRQFAYYIELTGEAAAAFRRPFGPWFSINPVGWFKGVLGNQYYFRGILAFDQLSSLRGAMYFSRSQMRMYRIGEAWRLFLYTAPVPVGVTGGVIIWDYLRGF